MEENCPVEADLIRPALDAVWARLTMLQRANCWSRRCGSNAANRSRPDSAEPGR